MKKGLVLIIVMMSLLLFPTFFVRADFGPKRTLDLEIIGVDQDYHLELLMPGTLPEGDTLSSIQEVIEEDDPNFPNMLYTFESEGYVSANLILPWGAWYQNPSEHYYIYSYNPPSNFKIMLIFDDDHYIISRPIETSLFNSKVTFNVTGVDLSIDQINVGRVREIFPIRTMSIELALRIIGTIFIEIIVLFLFGYIHKKSFSLVVLVNLVTQLLLTGFMFAAKYFIYPIIGELFVLIFGETMIFLSEIIIYRFYLTERSKNRAMVYALVANIIALIASYSVMILMMNM